MQEDQSYMVADPSSARVRALQIHPGREHQMAFDALASLQQRTAEASKRPDLQATGANNVSDTPLDVPNLNDWERNTVKKLSLASRRGHPEMYLADGHQRKLSHAYRPVQEGVTKRRIDQLLHSNETRFWPGHLNHNLHLLANPGSRAEPPRYPGTQVNRAIQQRFSSGPQRDEMPIEQQLLEYSGPAQIVRAAREMYGSQDFPAGISRHPNNFPAATANQQRKMGSAYQNGAPAFDSMTTTASRHAVQEHYTTDTTTATQSGFSAQPPHYLAFNHVPVVTPIAQRPGRIPMENPIPQAPAMHCPVPSHSGLDHVPTKTLINYWRQWEGIVTAQGADEVFRNHDFLGLVEELRIRGIINI